MKDLLQETEKILKGERRGSHAERKPVRISKTI